MELTYREAIEFYDFYTENEIDKNTQLMNVLRLYIAESVTVALNEVLPAMISKKKTGSLRRFFDEVKHNVLNALHGGEIAEIDNKPPIELERRFDGL